MDDAILYAKSHSFQRVTTSTVLHEFAHLLQWRKDGCDSVLDIGCGTGDVTIEVILPSLPSNFSHVLGCDISDEMIHYARRHNGHPKVAYDILDIGGNVDKFRIFFGAFDHAVSFFCLHWVRNHHAAMDNIFQLLTPNGDCLLVFIASSSTYTAWEEMKKFSNWSQYMEDVERFTSPYANSICPTDEMREILRTTGFTTIDIRTRQLKHVYNDFDEFADHLRSINPFVNRIPADEQEDFVSDLTGRIMARNKAENGTELLNLTNVLIVYAKK